MSIDDVHTDTCAAYGCPLLGSFGVGGKWFCVCHFRANAAVNDAITAELNRHRGIVDALLLARRTGAGHADIKALEDELISHTHEIGRQQSIPTAGVVGPTHAEPPFTETDA